MFRRLSLFVATLWICSLPLAFSEELASTTVCKVCSTIATFWSPLQSTVHSTSYWDVWPAASTVVKGKTVTRLDLTTTKTVTTYELLNFNHGIRHTNVRTNTVHNSSTLITTVCAPTSTPSDYPTSTYCNCQSTATTINSFQPTRITVARETYYTATQTVQPTKYGATTRQSTLIQVYPDPIIYHHTYTKTIYRATKTVTQPPNPTGTDFRTFKLKTINNPYVEGDFFRPFLVVSDYCPRTCGINFSDQEDATVFSLDNGSLHAITQKVTCGFHRDGSLQYDSYSFSCNATDALPGHLSIDCLGRLKGFVGNATDWAVDGVDSDVVGIYPQHDPVHGFNDGGKTDETYFMVYPKWVDLQVVPYSL